jgi:hypothetical protein
MVKETHYITLHQVLNKMGATDGCCSIFGGDTNLRDKEYQAVINKHSVGSSIKVFVVF